MLTSAPVSMIEIVLGKYVGLLTFLVLIIALVAAMPLSLAGSTDLDYPLLASQFLGVVLLAAGFAALALYISSLTIYPVGAAFGTFAALGIARLLLAFLFCAVDTHGLILVHVKRAWD